MVLSNNELMNITGGGMKIGLFLALGGFVTLLVGIVDGYLRPLACN
ncbi:MAG TPA: class IIb bacteriocin, lactobin A/cerein 7B family [Bacilli bacterium]|jgi:lactobin A/cerein 7B family class IIb bacteriocin|nr:class IIb bacteriocin, lactobin A/cerein 7B family [Bacilli bacterium]HPZ23620.1 class IIb bacteriocin, lactobin A/cerein 7B family [Bacilli bacterium]HQC84005.1 class IIb bacteriocin, lactobin A/cerein 7B family [Bacilli bacterium]